MLWSTARLDTWNTQRDIYVLCNVQCTLLLLLGKAKIWLLRLGGSFLDKLKMTRDPLDLLLYAMKMTRHQPRYSFLWEQWALEPMWH
jgi:hypothetical protein